MIRIPASRYTKQEDYDDIKMLSESTGVEIIEVNIENIFQSYRNILNSTDKKISVHCPWELPLVHRSQIELH